MNALNWIEAPGNTDKAPVSTAPELEFRCTRLAPYMLADCSGRTDLKARQGYYVKALCAEGAFQHMKSAFPDDYKAYGERAFTVQDKWH